MNQHTDRGRDACAPSRTERVYRDSGLNAGQQEARALRAQAWAARVLALQLVSGCDVRLALKAIEQADTEDAE